MQQADDDAGACAAHRVSEPNPTAVDIGDVPVEAKLPLTCEVLGGKRLRRWERNRE